MLIKNWAFCDGHHYQDGIPQIVVPDDWYAEWVDGVPVEGGDQPAARPEIVTVDLYSVSPEDQQEFFQVAGEQHRYTVKLFKGMAPLQASLKQDGVAVTAGRYLLRAWVYPDVVAGYDSGGKVWGGPWAGEIRLHAGEHTGDWLAPGHGTLTFGEYNLIELEVEFAEAGEITVELEVKNKWGLSNNGWWFWGVRLEPLDEPPAEPEPPVEPEPEPEPEPELEPPVHDYQCVVHVVSQSATLERAKEILGATYAQRRSILFSHDDAARIASQSGDEAHLWDIPAAEQAEYQAWYQERTPAQVIFEA